MYGLTGLPGSGKSEIGKVASEYGFPLVRMGDMVWDHVREHGMELDPAIVGKVAHERREKDGPDIWARVTADHIRKSIPDPTPEFAFIDGVRSIHEVERFRTEFLDFRIVAVHSSPHTRYERIMARKRVDDAQSYDAFMDREKRELSWGIAQVVALADVMLVNEGSLDELRKQATDLIF